MPTIFEPEDLPIIKKNGASVAVLADQAKLGTNALQVERIELKAAAQTALYEAVDAERFIYVIGGKGQAHVAEQSFPLEAESILWLEPGDAFYLEADSDGLEVLLCQAPAGK